MLKYPIAIRSFVRNYVIYRKLDHSISSSLSHAHIAFKVSLRLQKERDAGVIFIKNEVSTLKISDLPPHLQKKLSATRALKDKKP